MDDADILETARQIAEDLFDDGCTLEDISKIGLEVFNLAEDQKESPIVDLETWEPDEEETH